MDLVRVNLYKINPDVPTPSYGTSGSTCFDLSYFPSDNVVNGYDRYNNEVQRPVFSDGTVMINPGDRLLIPTGLIAQIERFGNRYSIRLHPRSGLSLKRGLVLANAEGVIDIDYQKQIYALITNISEVIQPIKRGERICQGEVVANVGFVFNLVDDIPASRSERNGGFGSTGTSS